MANSSSRGGTRVLWVTVHTAEGIRKATDLVAYFERSTNSSAHACADDSVLLDNLVPYERAAWTLRNGNTRSDNLELCGFASWTRTEWLTNHQGMLNHAAQWVRSRCLARGIPIVKIGAADVAAGRSGVIGHVDYTIGARDGTHTDPGPGFPWDVVIERAARSSVTPSPTSSQEDDSMVKFVHGDGPKPWGLAVFKVEYSHDGPEVAVRTWVTAESDPGYKLFLALGGTVATVAQKTLDAIPAKPGTKLPS